MSRIERVSYRSGFVKRLRESRHLPAITFEAADLPEDVVALVDAHLLDLGGTYAPTVCPRRATRSSTMSFARSQRKSPVAVAAPRSCAAIKSGTASRMFLVLPKEPHSPGKRGA